LEEDAFSTYKYLFQEEKYFSREKGCRKRQIIFVVFFSLAHQDLLNILLFMS